MRSNHYGKRRRSQTKELIDDIALRLFVERGSRPPPLRISQDGRAFRGHPLPPLRQQK